MDKESVIMGLIASAVIGFAVYGILHELQPIFLQAVTLTGIAIIIIVCAVCFAGLFIIIMLFTGNQNTAGNQIIQDMIETRKINSLNRAIFKAQLEAKRAELRNLEINHVPDILKDGRYITS